MVYRCFPRLWVRQRSSPTKSYERAASVRRLLEGINFTSIWDSVESIIDFQIVKALATNETARHAVAVLLSEEVGMGLTRSSLGSVKNSIAVA